MCNDPIPYADGQDALEVARTNVIRQARILCNEYGPHRETYALCSAVQHLERMKCISNWQSSPEKESGND